MFALGRPLRPRPALTASLVTCTHGFPRRQLGPGHLSLAEIKDRRVAWRGVAWDRMTNLLLKVLLVT